MASLLIANADYVITVDRERRIIRDGAIAVRDGRIAAVGKTAQVAPGFPEAEVIDARGKLALPGLFDTHTNDWVEERTSLAELKPGEFVTAETRTESGRLTAVRVVVIAPQGGE